MKTETPAWSEDFQWLYCDAGVYEGFSALRPISFARVLPFQAEDPAMDDARLLAAEAAHLAAPDDATRLAVVEAFGRCGLISAPEAANLRPVIDYFDADFFEFMGEVYAKAGMFICALRWHRELVRQLEEQQRPSNGSDNESVYASVGYCLFPLGLYAEACAWSRSCIGPRQTADTMSRALINYEALPQGGCIRCIERVALRTRYTASSFEPAQAAQITPRLKQAINTLVPFQETYIDWISAEGPGVEVQPEGYPFQAERDAGSLTRHRMNLIFALCGQAEELAAQGNALEAKRLLWEAALLEPQAEFIQDRLKTMP